MDNGALRDELFRYESALASRDPDGIDGGLIALIAEDFLEFGRSGRTWTRGTICAVLDGPPTPSVSIEAFDVALLADDVALVTYRAAHANRSSLWVRRAGRWQLRFHQGTSVED
jgi:hypothetical protein